MKASQKTLSDANMENQNFMKQAITDLMERLKVLEIQAKQKNVELREKDQTWNDYKVHELYIYLLHWHNLYCVFTLDVYCAKDSNLSSLSNI